MKIVTILIAIILSLGAFAGEKETKDEKKKGEFFKKELKLSDEQLAKVKEIRKGSKDEMIASKKNLFELRKKFQEAMKDSKTSNSELTEKFEAYQKARDEHQRKRFAMMLKMREVLTPAQMLRFQEVKRKFHKKFHKDQKG